MKKIVLATVAVTCLAGSAYAADMAVKAPPLAAPVATNPWDVAFGAGIYSDYNFRGISQSNRGPSVNAYFEPRYNVNDSLQLYVGAGGWSIDFSNKASAEIDIYGGIRPTFGKLALDFGVWYYYYPGGQCYNAAVPGDCAYNGNILPNAPLGGNVIKKDLSFLEYFAKATYTFNDNIAVGGAFYYDDNWLNFGFDAKYLSGNVKLTAPSNWLPTGYGLYVSGEVGHYWLGTTDAFYGSIRLPDYTTWNVGLGMTYKVFTVDLRYYDTDLSEASCNAITSDFNASFSPTNITAINTNGLGSKWCGQAYVISLKADLTYGSSLK
ncbi:TorF family putative porin [Rhodoplanes roseus]|uniref:Outer membrane protein beta-barrel domain-containing protein n=1 Tax=Rhodoplanes roseus TaxID=29409 RepID=A0A327KK46_9BRAD|nr:TorF family putative porin [Rhodoplanes roseus]RAI37943.1 hypothetical protein CH341_28740 [Rhodoplanes roseus]